MIIWFLASLIISTIIIYIVSKLFGEEEGIGTALLAGLIGAAIYALTYYFLGHGLLAIIIGGFAWLLALGSLYNMGWIKAFLVALVIWIVAVVVSTALPTLIGPL
ncbi:MAG: hypothetical protein HY831_03395 [Candidatus Aenigmarchaeota archaeon]|nr:hypothetical protein [Candidatus Aenigmarchaeota archaeon]